MIKSKYDYISKKILAMSSKEVIESLYRAGIITKKGKLRAKYKKK